MLSKLGPHDDIESYLFLFEQTTLRENWAKKEWAHILVPLLTDEPQRAYHSLPLASAEDYQILKEGILAQCGLSPCQAMGAYHCCRYDPSLTLRNQLDTLLHTTKCWLQPYLLSATQVTEWVAMDHFMQGLPPEETQAVGMRAPTTSAEIVEALECAIVTLEMSLSAARKRPSEMGQCPLWPAWLDAP